MGGNVSPICRVHSSYRDHPASYLLCSAGSLHGKINRCCKSNHTTLFSAKVAESVELYLNSPKTFSRCGALIMHRNNTASQFIFY